MKHIIKNFKPIDGHHCISTAYKQVFHYFGYHLSEEMIFGLASALNFFYFDFKVMPFPMIGGRNKIGEFEDNFEKHTGIKVTINKTSSIKKAREELYKLIKNDIPVPIYVDMAHLGYLRLPAGAHFGGHSIVVFGIDEQEDVAYISDRDSKNKKITLSKDENPSDFHKVKLKDLAAARASKYKPFPAENKWVTFDFSNIKELNREVIISAINKNSVQFLEPQIKNLGIKGIELFVKKITTWKQYDDKKLNQAAFNAFLMINEIGGTGGGIFRRMFGKFLIESSDILNEKKKELKLLGNNYLNLSVDWDEVGNDFITIAKTLDRNILDGIKTKLEMIYEIEKNLMVTLTLLMNSI